MWLRLLSDPFLCWFTERSCAQMPKMSHDSRQTQALLGDMTQEIHLHYICLLCICKLCNTWEVHPKMKSPCRMTWHWLTHFTSIIYRSEYAIILTDTGHRPKSSSYKLSLNISSRTYSLQYGTICTIQVHVLQKIYLLQGAFKRIQRLIVPRALNNHGEIPASTQLGSKWLSLQHYLHQTMSYRECKADNPCNVH